MHRRKVPTPNPAWLFLGKVVSHMNHHSKILQHSHIRIAHTDTCDVCDPFVNCDHHSKILQHHRIIARSHTHAYDVCDPFVTITPRFYNIVQGNMQLRNRQLGNLEQSEYQVTLQKRESQIS